MRGIMAAHYQNARRLARALRVQRGLTQEQLAERAGLDYKYYQLFECERTRAPSLRLIEALASVFGLKPWVFLCDDAALVRKMTGIGADALAVKHKPGRPVKRGKASSGKRKSGGRGR